MSSIAFSRNAAAEPEIYGVAAQFDTVEEIMEAADRTRKAGYKKIDAYVPFPIEGLDEKLGMKPTRLGWAVLVMATIGLIGGFYMQWFANVEFYPLNAGGKPFNSWPNFIVIMYELTILLAAFTAGLGMLGLNGLPRPYHSIFNTPGFERASRDKFFLCIEAKDKKFDREKVTAFLQSLGPENVAEVEK